MPESIPLGIRALFISPSWRDSSLFTLSADDANGRHLTLATGLCERTVRSLADDTAKVNHNCPIIVDTYRADRDAAINLAQAAAALIARGKIDAALFQLVEAAGTIAMQASIDAPGMQNHPTKHGWSLCYRP